MRPPLFWKQAGGKPLHVRGVAHPPSRAPGQTTGAAAHLRQLPVVVDELLPGLDVARGNHLQAPGARPTCQAEGKNRGNFWGLCSHCELRQCPRKGPNHPTANHSLSHLVVWWLSRTLTAPVVWLSASQ